MIGNCNINNLAKNQVSAIFLSLAICRSVLPKFTELCEWRRHVGAHTDGHQHGGRKPTETSVTECCYKSVNLSQEELENNTVLLQSNSRTVQLAKYFEISLGISHFLTTRPSCKYRFTQKLTNSSVVYHKTKSPVGTNIRMDISFQLLLYIM